MEIRGDSPVSRGLKLDEEACRDVGSGGGLAAAGARAWRQGRAGGAPAWRCSQGVARVEGQPDRGRARRTEEPRPGGAGGAAGRRTQENQQGISRHRPRQLSFSLVKKETNSSHRWAGTAVSYAVRWLPFFLSFCSCPAGLSTPKPSSHSHFLSTE